MSLKEVLTKIKNRKEFYVLPNEMLIIRQHYRKTYGKELSGCRYQQIEAIMKLINEHCDNNSVE